MLRRLHPEQPESFAFTEANQAWAEAQITKYPEGRQASAIIPLLWRAQEQEGWLSRPAIEHVAGMLDLAYIRALEVATFYFMFQLKPVGSVAHLQICGTTSCMICGAEDLVAVCREKIAANAHELSADGKFSWEEVECLGACANAPMAQIGKDYYEDLTVERLGEIIDEMAEGKVPVPGPQNGRYAAEPLSGLTSLTEFESGKTQYNVSAQFATDLGDTIKRIDGTEVPLTMPWQRADERISDAEERQAREDARNVGPSEEEIEDEEIARPVEGSVADDHGADGGGVDGEEASAATFDPARANESADDKEIGADGADAAAESKGAAVAADEDTSADTDSPGIRPEALDGARGGQADDLKRIKGVGPKLEKLLNRLGFYHFDQIAGWSEDEVAWVDDNLESFKGRVTRDEWVAQAADLANR